jgi:trans-2,3-dihydro-3-hydroxyanthranilate isomerase
MQIPFVTVNVFTDRKFGGNPLAVVPDGSALTDAQMQAIAGEFNLAETTFVLPPQDPAHTAEVRIFTPRAELPFAGHPNIGTAFVLANENATQGRALTATMIFEEQAGLVRLSLLTEAAAVVGARLVPPQPLQRGEDVDTDIVAAACSLAATDIESGIHRPCVASCGNPLVFAELKTRAALARARPRAEMFTKHLPAERITGVLLYVHDRRDGFDLQVRMFAPLYGIPEDPATGSGNVALAGLLGSETCAPHRARHRYGPTERARSRRRKTRRQGCRHDARRTLRADDARRVGGVMAFRHGRTCSGHLDGKGTAVPG